MGWRLTQPLMHNARYGSGAVATSFEGRRRTWPELQARVARLAGALRSLGVERGDRVGILAENADYYFETMLATWWLGSAINPVNIRWSASEIAYSLDDCATHVLIVDSSSVALVPELRKLSASLDTVIIVDGDGDTETLDYEALIRDHAPVDDAGASGDDLAGVFYTGGTTGFPKGVALTHDSMVANTFVNLLEMPLQSDDVVLAISPMFHLAAMCITVRALFRGATCSFVRGFEERAFLEAVERDGVTFTLLVPVMIQRLLECDGDLLRSLSTLRLIQYGAAPIGETLLRRVIDSLPHVSLVQGYGMTETSGPYTVLPAWAHRDIDGPGAKRLGSAGRPVIGVEMRIRRDDGTEAEVGEVGEVTCSGSIVMREYWNKPETSAAALSDGYLRSGDVGYVDEEGFLYLVDRAKDMIVSGGENVYSAEVETALAKHPDVAACAVIGIPSERWGEQVHAIVVLRAGAEADAADLRSHCKRLIAGYKCPVSVDFRELLPYTTAGKVQKNVLREQYWQDKARRVG